MLEISGVTKSFGARKVLDDVSLRVPAGGRVGLVGRNGEGKTTLLRIICGIDPPEDGAVRLKQGHRVGYLKQEVDPASSVALIDEVRKVQAPLRSLEARLRALEDQIAGLPSGSEVPPDLSKAYDATQREFELRGGFEAEALLESTLIGLGMGPDLWHRSLCELSGGWLMRAELAKLLLDRPEVLLLDEPTNHLDLPSIAWFEGVLAEYPGAVLVVSHDRAFLDRHTTLIAELEQGRLATYKGNYSAYREQRAQRLEDASARHERLERQIRHAQQFVDRFGAKASKAAQAEGRKKQIAKLRAEQATLVQAPKQRSVRFRFPPAPRSGDLVLRLERVAFSYGEKRVYRSLDLELRRGERVALVGPNGAGKTTLLRLAAGALTPEAGTCELGHNVRLAYYAQHQLEALDGGRTVLEELGADAPIDLVPRLRNLLGTFLFSGDDVDKRVSVLSGGERARLALAKLMLRGANFLVLDEPTNHLDIQAIDVLTNALDSFDGTLLLISHDRHFLNGLTSRVVEVEPGDGSARIDTFPGNYDAYLERKQALANASARPAVDRDQRAPARPPAKRKASGLSNNALRKLEREAEAAEAAIVEGERALEAIDFQFADPALARDGERVRELTTRRDTVRAEVEAHYARWEELSAEIEDARNG